MSDWDESTGEHRLCAHEPEEPDWSDESSGHPLLATVIGAIALILTVFIPHVRAMLGGQHMVAYLVASTLGGGVIVWGIALAVTVRKSAIGWKIGSLAALTFVSACVTLGRLGSGDMSREDAATVARQINDAVKNADHPDDIKIAAGTGAGSRMNAAVMGAMIADRKAFEAETIRSGLRQIITVNGLTKGSPVLDHCGNIDALVARTDYYGGRLPAFQAAADAIGNKAVQDGEIDHSAVAAFDRGMAGSRSDFERSWLLTGQIAAEAGDLCRLLAKRHWVLQGGKLLITNQDDLTLANAYLSRINQINADLQAMRRTALDQASAQADQLSLQ
jgi:hypothetical protein